VDRPFSISNMKVPISGKKVVIVYDKMSKSDEQLLHDTLSQIVISNKESNIFVKKEVFVMTDYATSDKKPKQTFIERLKYLIKG
jgi:hypothetical protein